MKSVLAFAWGVIVAFPAEAGGRFSLHWDEVGPEEGNGRIQVEALSLEVRAVREHLVPVAGLQTGIWVLGPLVPSGALALDQAWNRLHPDSEIWNQDPGWKLPGLPRSWTHAGAYLGQKGSPGGVYLRWSPYCWLWGAFFTGFWAGSPGDFRFFGGTEGSHSLPANPEAIPYGQAPWNPRDPWKTKGGVEWQAGSLSFQTWGWAESGEFYPPRWSGILLGSWREVPWTLRVLAMGQTGRIPGRQSALVGSLERAFSSGILGFSGVFEILRDPQTTALNGSAWSLGIRAAMGEDLWKVSCRGEWSGEEGSPWGISGVLEGEAGWDILKGFIQVRPGEVYQIGVKSRYGLLETRGSYTPEQWELRVRGDFAPFEVSTKILWLLTGSPIPKTWELNLAYEM